MPPYGDRDVSGGAAEPRSAESLLAGWQVDDIAAAVARVGEAGGQATERESQTYGLMADCKDEQRERFQLGQL